MKKALGLSIVWQALVYFCLFGLSSYTMVSASGAAAVRCTPSQNSLTGPDTAGKLPVHFNRASYPSLDRLSHVYSIGWHGVHSLSMLQNAVKHRWPQELGQV